jgi:2-amino-4-hydroxy-6-hydroxymethyldihydropteridine diphosphokinase
VMQSRAFIALGSNLDHPRRQLARAVRAIGRIAGTRVLRRSPNYLSAALDSPDIDGVPAPDYVNAVVQVATALTPRSLLRHLQRIERRQGRVRSPSGTRNLPRTLDLDLLLFDGRRMRTAPLSLPHPRMHQRAFVLRPLGDIAPHATIPGRGLARFRLAGVAGQGLKRTRGHPVR